jgi:hypothetical protein
VRAIARFHEPLPDAAADQVRWRIGGTLVAAQIVQGPGGSFLSNEVAYRTQRALGIGSERRAPLSFHVHTQTAPDAGDALATTVRADVMRAVTDVVSATARAAAARRAP